MTMWRCAGLRSPSKNRDEDVLVLFTAADLRGTLRKICPRCLFCYPRAPSVSIFSPRPENLFATSRCKQLTRCSLLALSNKVQLKKYSSDIDWTVAHLQKLFVLRLRNGMFFCLLKSFIKWQNNPSTSDLKTLLIIHVFTLFDQKYFGVMQLKIGTVWKEKLIQIPQDT